MTAHSDDQREAIESAMDEYLRLSAIQEGIHARLREQIRFIESKGGVDSLPIEKRLAYLELRRDWSDDAQEGS